MSVLSLDSPGRCGEAHPEDSEDVTDVHWGDGEATRWDTWPGPKEVFSGQKVEVRGCLLWVLVTMSHNGVSDPGH